MKQLKKWAAVLLAFMLVVTLMPANSIAAEPTSKIIVQGVEDGATVNAYKLTEATFLANGDFDKYQNVGAGAFADPAVPTTAEWSELIKKPVADLGTAIPLTQAAAGKDYESAPQGAGLYMILVTSKEGKVYNPMLVGISYDKATDGTESAKGGTISVPAEFKLGEDAVLYLKKSEVKITKTTEDPSPEDQSTNDSDHGNGLGLNEKPSFKINTTIPSYPTTDKNLKFTITDTLDPGLTPPAVDDINVTVAGTKVTADQATVTVAGQIITIEFKDAYLKGLNGATKDVEVTYSATLNDQATVNFAANKNTVKVEYTHDPKTGDTSTHEDITYHYTFDIDGLLNGKGSETSHELTKHGKIDGETKWYTKDSGLQGAEFTLYSGDPTGKKIVEGKTLNELQADEVLKYQTVTTTDDGRMNFQKLDEGIYYLKETKAPNGYSLNNKVYKVEIKADYNTNGTLKSYSITIDDQATTTFKAQNEEQAPDTTNNPDAKQDGVVTETDAPTLIENTKIPGLPSTGGMGTYLFTGIGVALLAGAAVMVTVLRKKSAQAAQ